MNVVDNILPTLQQEFMLKKITRRYLNFERDWVDFQLSVYCALDSPTSASASEVNVTKENMPDVCISMSLYVYVWAKGGNVKVQCGILQLSDKLLGTERRAACMYKIYFQCFTLESESEKFRKWECFTFESALIWNNVGLFWPLCLLRVDTTSFTTPFCCTSARVGLSWEV